MPIRVNSDNLKVSIKFCQKFLSKKEMSSEHPVYSLKLHGKTVNVNLKSISERDFVDNETFQQFLRLKWINEEVLDSEGKILGLSEKYSLLLLFLKLTGLKTDFPHKHAYILSERLSNIHELLFNENTFEVPDIIRNIANIYGGWIAKDLELYLFDLTGNHIINNARGLAFAAKLSSNTSYNLISQKILNRYLDQLLINNFLREGSTHYHLLFCLWLTDLKILYSKEEFSKYLDTYKKIINSAYSIFVFGEKGYSFPLIGDISPDRSPNDLIDYFHDHLSKKKENQFNRTRKNIIKENKKIISSQGLTFLGDIIRVDFEDISLFVRTPPNQSFNLCASHEHRDFGSIVIYSSGEPVIIDAGRPNYILKETVCPYVQSNIHNFPILNKTPYYTKRDRFVPLSARKFFPVYSINDKDGDLELSFQLTGSNCSAQRHILFKNRKIIIKDKVIGSLLQKSCLNFLIPDNVNIEPFRSGAKLNFKKNQIKFTSENATFNISQEDISLEYGSLKKINCLKSNAYGNWESHITIETVL